MAELIWLCVTGHLMLLAYMILTNTSRLHFNAIYRAPEHYFSPRHNCYWPVEPTLYSHDAEGSGGSAVAEAPIAPSLSGLARRAQILRDAVGCLRSVASRAIKRRATANWVSLSMCVNVAENSIAPAGAPVGNEAIEVPTFLRNWRI